MFSEYHDENWSLAPQRIYRLPEKVGHKNQLHDARLFIFIKTAGMPTMSKREASEQFLFSSLDVCFFF